MRRIRLHQVVEYLRSVEFYHDTFDLEEEGVEAVLREYGICEHFSDEEVQELRRDLYPMAEQNEFREAAVLAGADELLVV